MSNPYLPEFVQLYDTTLRDCPQQEGIQLSVYDKFRIAKLLDELGVDFIEGGWPGANPADTEFFAKVRHAVPLHHAKLVAFGATRRPGIAVEDDPQIQALIDAGTDYVCILAKAHPDHVMEALHTDLAENLAMIEETVQHLVAAGKKVFVDAEHYFDGFKVDASNAFDVVRTAADAGAQVVTLCDTNGGSLPHEIDEILTSTLSIGIDLGIRTHNDTGCAVANTLAAVSAGATQVQGTINGYGERAGIVDLTTVIPNLQLKYDLPLLSDLQLESLTRISNAIADIANQPHMSRQPYVGSSVFAVKTGLHAAAARVNAALYQHLEPSLVGNDTHTLISGVSGRANIQLKSAELGLEIFDEQIARLLDQVKAKAAEGYAFDAADASFELLALDELGQDTHPFELVRWSVLSTGGEPSQAQVELIVKGLEQQSEGRGNGPLDALKEALVHALKPGYPQVREFVLSDYRVRSLEDGQGTSAACRVLVDLTDGKRTWTTVGVGTNVVEASWEALFDAYRFGLVKGYGLPA